MPFFSANAAARIGRATRRVERQPRQPRGRRGRWQGRQTRPRWYQLTAPLDAGGTAAAQRLRWDAAAGAYVVDAAETVVLADLVGQHWGLGGERLRAELRRADSGAVYEVVSRGAPWHWATLDGELAAGGSASATVTVAGADVALTVHDLWLEAGESLPAGTAVGVTYDLHGARWVDTEAACNCDGGYY